MVNYISPTANTSSNQGMSELIGKSYYDDDDDITAGYKTGNILNIGSDAVQGGTLPEHYDTAKYANVGSNIALGANPGGDDGGFLNGLGNSFKTDGTLDWGKIASFGKIITGGVGAYLSAKHLGLMKKQFQFQKSFDKTNLYNSAMASNIEHDKAVTGQRNRNAAGNVQHAYNNQYDDSRFADLGLPENANSNTVSNKKSINNSKLKSFGTLVS